MSNNSFSHLISPSNYLTCSVCGHYVGDHHDKGCSVDGCECGNGFYSMAKDMRSNSLKGYVEQFSYDTKIAVLIGNSYHIFGIPEAEELARFILAITDVAKMTTIQRNPNPHPDIGETTMEYQKAYKIAHEISEFFHLNFDGRKKGQLSQIILNNVREGEELEATPEDTDLVTIPRAMVLGLEQTIKSLRAELDKCQHALDDEDSTNG